MLVVSALPKGTGDTARGIDATCGPALERMHRLAQRFGFEISKHMQVIRHDDPCMDRPNATALEMMDFSRDLNCRIEPNERWSPPGCRGRQQIGEPGPGMPAFQQI